MYRKTHLHKALALLLTALLLFSLCACSISAEDAAEIAGDVAEVLLTEDSTDYELADSSAENSQLSDYLYDDLYDYEDAYLEDSAYVQDEYETAEIDVSEPDVTQAEEVAAEENEDLLDIDGSYTSKEDVALYIHQYGCLPSNFITKKEAQALGWPGGSLEPYAPGKCIGGSYFGNYEGILPTASGRSYTECDIDTLGADSRGAKRIVFSNDGLIYYTEDHYETFELLYGEP